MVLAFLCAIGLRLVLITAVFPLTTGIASFDALFAPSADLWERWTAHDPSSTAVIDHSTWDGLLARYRSVGQDGIARFAYARVSADDRAALAAYIASLAATPIRRYSRDEQLAYWINLYNALTVSVVLEHYPIASIRDIDISPGLFGDGPWDKKLVEIEGERVSLNDIEHRILRPIWRDSRIHYAVNCVSLGCPDLPSVAFTGANAESLLEKAARNYVNHPRGAQFVDGKLVVSSIYVWFKKDFGGSDEDVIAHLRRYAETSLQSALNGARGIADHRYSWALNDAHHPAP